MRIKVVAWNMNQRSAGGNWPQLRRDPEMANADIFLLCEATGLPSLAETNGITAIGNGSTKGLGCPCPEPDSCRRRRYSTAVAFIPSSSSDHRVRQGKPLRVARPSRPGSWTVARIAIEDTAITAVALYGLNDEPYVVTSARRSLSELAPVLSDQKYSEHLVLGGDFNILAGKPPRETSGPGRRVLP